MAERIERDAVYNTDDVARIMGLKAAAIRRWIREGRLPATKVGKRYRVRGADLLALVGADPGRPPELGCLQPSFPLEPGSPHPLDEAHYRHLAALLGRVATALEEGSSRDERCAASAGFAKKLFFHAATLYWLGRGTSLGPFPGFRDTVFDYPSAYVIARAALETYLAFYYVVCEPQSADEFTMRHAVWQLVGFQKRVDLPVLPESKAQQVRDEQFTADLRKTIERTQAFRNLTTPQKKSALKGKRWHTEGLPAIARRAGIPKQFAKLVYDLLCIYAHSDGLSIMQLRDATPEVSLEFIQNDLLFIAAIVAEMAVECAEHFSEAAERLERHRQAARLAREYAKALRQAVAGEQQDTG